MTTARSVTRKDVERVYSSLEQAFLTECPEYEQIVALDPLLIRAPKPSSRAFALWEAFILAWSARMRFVRRRVTKSAKKRGRHLPTLDDRLRDQAIQSLERALTLTENAARLLAEDAEAMEGQARKLRMTLEAQPREDAELAQRTAATLAQSLGVIRRFRGVFQIRSQREWDAFISQTAAKLGEIGMPSREIAALLTGVSLQRIDRSELERFRQRVRRLKDSDSYKRTKEKSVAYAD